jgi:Predicted membrane protein (DUF2231)
VIWMFHTVSGLPLHPLIVHAVVVIGPLSAVGAVAYALVSRWRGWLRWLVFLGALVTAASAWVARQSGLFLEPLVTQGQPATGQLARHILWATRLVYATWGWLALVLVFCLLVPMALRQRASTPVAANAVGGVLLIAGAAALVVLTVITGDAASHAVWGGYIK